MRRTFARITITAAATAGLAATTYVQALGLGEIDVSSNLNQRFLATIPLSEISEEDLETVTVTVAPNEAFDRAGIDRAEYLSSLDFQIKNDRGRPRVVVSSSQIAREPVLNLLVQARWSGGKILRDYTILLDPQELAAPAPAAVPRPLAAPVIAVTPAPAPVLTKPVVPAPAPKLVAAPPPKAEFYETPTESKAPKKAATAPIVDDSAFDSATGSYGPVAAKETLWSIATKVRPGAAISMDQVLLALSEANPVAIQKGTTVSKGVTLRVPSAERMQANSAAAAKAKLAALRGGSKVVTAKPATAVPATSLAEKLTVAEPAAPNAPATPAAPPAAPVSDKAAPAKTVATPVASVPAAASTPAPAAAATSPSAAVSSSPVIAGGTTMPPKPEPAVAGAADATAASAAATSAAPAVTAPTTPAPAEPPATASAKSPLAQPLSEPAPAGMFDGLALPLGLGALLLAGGAFLLARRRKNAVSPKSTSHFKPGDTSTVQTPVGGSGALGRLGDTTRLSDTQILTAGAAASATQQLTQPVTAPPPAFSSEATLILEPEAMATLNTAVTQSAVTSGSESFDRTTQIQVDTLQINLGDNDPISEADFHLAYGLYDEAILLLKGAVSKQPQRADLQVKLAETYFAAGRPMEFQETAEDLHSKLSPADWSKIAIMGSQICPDVAMFQGAGDSMSMDADFDLAFDEVAAPAAPRPPAPNPDSIDFSLSLPASAIMSLTPSPAPAPHTPPAVPASNSMLGLDLDFDDDLNDNVAPQPPAGLDDEASIDFMLGQSITPLGAGLILPNDRNLGFNLGSPKFSVELPQVGKPAAPSLDTSLLAYELSERPTLVPNDGMLSFSLQDLAVSITPRENAAETPDDELNTKLDLARAYVEMGDGDMARSLLLEVQQQGSERHQQEAATLLQRLPA